MTTTGAADEEPRRRPVYEVILSLDGLARIAAVVVVAVVILSWIARAQAAIGLILVAAVCAVCLEPFITKLGKSIGSATALVAVHVAALVLFGGLAALVAWDLDVQANSVQESLHSAIRNLEPGSWPAALATDIQADKRIDSFFGNIATRSVAGGDAAGAVLHRVGQAILVTVLSAFLVAGRKQMLNALTSLTPSKERRRAIRNALGGAAETAGRYLRRTIVVSAGHGLVVAGITAALGYRTGVSLACAAALLSTVPMLGPAAAWTPTFALATAHSGQPALFVVAIAAAATVVDWIVRDRYVERAVHVGPLLVALGLAAGVAAGGIAGAGLGLFAVAWAASLTATPVQVAGVVDKFVEERTANETLAPVMAGVSGTPRAVDAPRLSVRISWRSALAAAAFVLAAASLRIFLARTGSLAIWLVIALIVALGLDRPISYIQRRVHLPRMFVVIAGALFVIVAGTVGLAATAPQATRSSSNLVADAPEVVASLQNLPLIGPVLENANAADRVERAIQDLPDRVGKSGIIERAASLAGNGVVGAFWTIVILLSALIDGPRLVDLVAGKIPVRHRRQYIRLARAGQSAVARYAAGSALVAALNGTMVLIGALLLGVPLAPVLALWAMAWNFVPQIGGFMGGAPFVLLAFGQGPIAGVIAFVGFIVYQNIENHLIQPTVIGRSIDLPPWVALVAALVGASVGGLLGAVLAVPLVGAIKVMVAEWRRDDLPLAAPRMRPRRLRIGRRAAVATH